MMTSSNGNIFRVTGHLCGKSPVTGEFPAQRPVTRSFDVFSDLRLNKRLSKQSWGWWFETPPRPLWRHCNDEAKCSCPELRTASHWEFNWFVRQKGLDPNTYLVGLPGNCLPCNFVIERNCFILIISIFFKYSRAGFFPMAVVHKEKEHIYDKISFRKLFCKTNE